MNLVARRFRLAPSPDQRDQSPRVRSRTRSRYGPLAACGLTLALTYAPASTHAQTPGDAATPRARVASAPSDGSSNSSKLVDINHAARPAGSAVADPIAQARQLIADSRARYQAVQDYSCTFYKRERIDGKLSESHVMLMKARTRPTSLYFKFVQPNAGREAIWIDGKNNGKVIAHEAGLNKVLAGTMHLDPKGDMAMEDNRHPISEAGIGAMIETVTRRWSTDLIPGVTTVVLHPHAKVGDRPCTMVETIHDARKEHCAFGRVKLYIDQELGLPIRFEGYAWPTRANPEGDLLEEYTYFHLKINPGLKDRDFDPRNAQYSYGRF